MTDDQAAAPKRTAMQVALAAEGGVNELREELANISALAEAAAESGGGAPVGGVLAELREKVDGHDAALRVYARDLGKVWGLIPANLLTHGGAFATQQQVAEMHGNLTHLVEQLAAMPDYAGSDSKLKPQALFDSVLAVDGRLREVEEWRAAELDPDNLGAVDGLGEAVRELRADVENLRTHLAYPPMGVAAGAAPARAAALHVLGQIAQLQKLVYEIGKGREFKAENQRGDVTQQYSFRGIDEAQNAIGSAQREIGLIGPKVTIIEKDVKVVEVNKGSYTQVWTTVSVTCRYTFQSPVDGSEWSTEGCGMGRDLGDKAESKALAGAFKYALFHGLNIPVKGVFVDAETADPRIEREHQQQDGGRTYGHGQPPSDPADVMASQAFDRAMQDPTPENVQASLAAQQAAPANREPDTRTPEQLTHDALAAIRRAGTLADAVKVWNYAAQAGCLSMHIENAQLGQHMLAAIRLLPGGNAVQLPGMEHFR